MSKCWMKIWYNKKDKPMLFIWSGINLCFSWIFFSSFWWNHEQWLSMLIMKKSSQSVSHIKCRTFPCDQHSSSIEECWWQLESVTYDKIETMALPSACQMQWIWFQDHTESWHLSEVITCDFFDLMLCSTLINSCAWKSARKNICQFLNFPLAPYSIFKTKKVSKGVQPSRFNVCFRGLFASS